MPTDPNNDRDLNTGCDALSFGLKLLMVPAELDAVSKPLAAVGDRCSDRDPIICP
jgi:hypothetical protein